MSTENYFTKEQKQAMVNAIRQAEKNTSGEIRVHIENHCRKEVLDRSVELFARLNMHQTALRNGVLIYIAIKDHKLAIIGDTGIHSRVPENFWDGIKNQLVEKSRHGLFTEGICEAVACVGEQLRQWFPHHQDDVNELSDEISFSR